MASVAVAKPPPDDYLERVYAGVLGKLIGVYLGRPIEQWPHKRIMERFGHIRYYILDDKTLNLVDADDDISGTFAFIRALEEHGCSAGIPAADIGRTWLNNSVDLKCPFWWGGRGYSTEHTAYINLANGLEAPRSGSIETNGKTVAEQIGGQIFIDGWALVAPGQPDLAARLADAAASVSHDGEARFAARSWAAMEAEAFLSKDVEHLLEVGARYIPTDSKLAKVVADVREWAEAEPDWMKVRQMIEDKYGYDKFCGSCHILPNHAIMILGLIHGGHSFHEAMHIINTCGWDTDCNSGNLGCLLAIMHGLDGIDNGGPDWRGPVADRAVISSADGGYTVNNATRIAYDIANSGRRLAGHNVLEQPKDSQYHFTLPGAVQGFEATSHESERLHTIVKQSDDPRHGPGLMIEVRDLEAADSPVEITTPTFVQPETRKVLERYAFVGTPLVYPGQRVIARVHADGRNPDDINVNLVLRVYGPNPHPADAPLYSPNPDLDILVPAFGPGTTLSAGQSADLEWTIPDNMSHQPIARIGIALRGSVSAGTVWLDRLGWKGAPEMRLTKPENAALNPSQVWREAWINGASTFNWYMPHTFGISKDHGEGKIITGTRDWLDYTVTAERFSVVLGTGGVMVRNRGINRYYALCFEQYARVKLVKAHDEKRIELASVAFEWNLDREYEVAITVKGSTLRGFIDGEEVVKGSDDQFASGGIGLVVMDGAVTADAFTVSPA